MSMKGGRQHAKNPCMRCRCSGNDAVHMCEGASPQLSRCKLQAKHSGLWAFDKAKAVLTECTIEECGWVGVKLFDSASVRLHR